MSHYDDVMDELIAVQAASRTCEGCGGSCGTYAVKRPDGFYCDACAHTDVFGHGDAV
jgi:hypothetical protein